MLPRLKQKDDKMKFFKLVLAATALTGFAASAQAQDTGVYVNLGAEAVEFDSYNITGRLGYQFTENFSVEGQGSFGVADDEVLGVDIGVDNSFAAFARGSVPLSEQFSLFARGGYHFTQFGAEGQGFDESLDVDGFAFGGGAEFMFDGMNGLRADVTFFDSSDDSINGVDFSGTSETYSIAYVRKF
jgi:outer membrane immunogenic protein